MLISKHNDLALFYICAYILFFRTMSYQAKAAHSYQLELEAQAIELQKETEALKTENARLHLEESELEKEKRMLEKRLKTAPYRAVLLIKFLVNYAQPE